MQELHAAESAKLLSEELSLTSQFVRPQLSLAPRLAEQYDLDWVARSFAEWVWQMNLDSVFLGTFMQDRDVLFDELVDLGNISVLTEAVESGRSVIILPFHIGPCYPSISILSHLYPVTTTRHDLPFDELHSTFFPELDLSAIYAPSRNMLARCFLVLRQRRLLSILPERDPAGIGPNHICIPFMGTHVAAPTGPFQLAERTQATIVPYTFRRTGPARFSFYFEPSLVPGVDYATPREGVVRIWSAIERILLEDRPGEWEMWPEFANLADQTWVDSHLAREVPA
jgi:lauroyl/myristoyl acyltransferase